MTAATPSRIGVLDGAAPANNDAASALFLKKFGGEVLTAFNETNVMTTRHIVRTIENGKSAQFPATWKTDAQYHTPGNPLLGTNSVKHNERIITIDDMLESDIVVSNIDEMKNHYDIRAIYSKQMGDALARAYDKNVMQVGLKAAAAAATVSGGFGGTVITTAATDTNGATLAGEIFTAAETFDGKDIPATERYAFVKPAQYYLLVQTTDLINKDWGGRGSFAEGNIWKVADIEIVKTNNLPQANVAAVTGQNNDYAVDARNTTALVLHKSAVGTVKLLDLTMQMTGGDFAVMYQGTLMVAKYVMGHGILRPECAVQIRSAVPV